MNCVFVSLHYGLSQTDQLKGIMLNRTETPKYNLKPLQLWLGFKCRSNLCLRRIIKYSKRRNLRTSGFGLSTVCIWNAARNILTQTTAKDRLKYSSCFILKFHVPTGFLRWWSYVKFAIFEKCWKRNSSCGRYSHIKNGLFKVNCWIIE